MKTNKGINLVELPIHFDVPQHYLPLSDFIELATNVNNIIDEFSRKFFEGTLDIQVVVLPPEDGSFLKKLGIVAGVATISWGFLNSTIGEAYIKGLTGNTPAYWAEIAGEETKEIFILNEATKGFIEKDVKTIEGIGIPQEDFKVSFSSKNLFYKSCLKNESIAAIGFSEKETFTIQRGNFQDRIANLNTEPEDDFDLEYKLHELIIISSVNTSDSEGQWDTRDNVSNEFLRFHMKDMKFFDDFLSGQYPLKENESNDVILALIEYKKLKQGDTYKVVERNAVKIYRFNDKEIAEVPDNLSIEVIEQVKNNIDSKQTSMF